MSADGSRLWPVVVPAPKGVGPMTAFDITPDGARIVYSTCDYPKGQPGVAAAAGEQLDMGDYGYELAVATIDGGEVQRLTTNGSFDNYPAWSPDGSQIAYVSSSSDLASVRRSSRLHVMQSDGTGRQSLWGGLDAVATDPPAWSPDGRWVAVAGVSDTGGRLALHLVSIESGQEFVRLSDAVSGAWSWSPDGQRLAFAKREGARLALYTVAADGTDAQRVTRIEGWRSWWPSGTTPDIHRTWVDTVAWSPDGSKILYSCNGICVVTPDGSPVSQAPLPGNLAAWSPDGSRIVTISTGDPNPNRRDNPVISTMAPDGSDLRVLVQEAVGGLVLAQFDYADVTAAQAACAAGLVVDAPAENPRLVRDCETLLGLRNALFPNTLVNWGPGTPIAQWVGVTVDGAPPRVTGLLLRGGSYAGLRLKLGTLPPELGQLTALRTLDLGAAPSDGLSGPIPLELGQLANLEVLALSSRNITGVIPPELGQLTQLRRLTLTYSQITGRIPSALSQLESLTQLNLGDSQLTGAIPAELGQLSNLEALLLGGNQLTGAIPSALGQLESLIELNLGGDQLTGAIPAELGQLSNLEALLLGGNQLTGAIPSALGQLESLIELNLGGNQLTGAIPAELGQLSNLEALLLGGNQLTGAIPSALGQLESLIELNLGGNQLTGAIPAELGQLSNLEALLLGGNQLTGCIPPSLQRISYIDHSSLGLPDCEPA